MSNDEHQATLPPPIVEKEYRKDRAIFFICKIGKWQSGQAAARLKKAGILLRWVGFCDYFSDKRWAEKKSQLCSIIIFCM